MRIRLRGIVQGVGFRPFVHNLAGRLQLTGYVLNSSAGLVAEVEGDPAAVARFLDAVRTEAPPLAWIQEMDVAELDPTGGAGFEIRHSAVDTGEFALISPDVATCPECLLDIPRARQSALRLSLYELHQLRASIHHHSRYSL